MIPSEKLVGVADVNMTEPKGVLLNPQIEVENFKFLADIVVMDMFECLVSVG